MAGVATALFTIGFALNGIVSRSPAIFQWWGSRWGKWMLLACGMRVRADVPSPLDPDTTYVFVANHQNSLDIPAVLVAIKHSFGFVAKAELEKTPFLGWALAISPSVFVDSRNARRSRESMIEAAHQVERGSSVLVFPEGRRSWSTEVNYFKRSAFALAAGAGVPVVPVAIMNAHTLFDERRYLSRPGTIDIIVGSPINPASEERTEIDALSRQARESILAMMASVKSGPAIGASS